MGLRILGGLVSAPLSRAVPTTSAAVISRDQLPGLSIHGLLIIRGETALMRSWLPIGGPTDLDAEFSQWGKGRGL